MRFQKSQPAGAATLVAHSASSKLDLMSSMLVFFFIAIDPVELKRLRDFGSEADFFQLKKGELPYNNSDLGWGLITFPSVQGTFDPNKSNLTNRNSVVSKSYELSFCVCHEKVKRVLCLHVRCLVGRLERAMNTDVIFKFPNCILP
jgi:hypothetical protein